MRPRDTFNYLSFSGRHLQLWRTTSKYGDDRFICEVAILTIVLGGFSKSSRFVVYAIYIYIYLDISRCSTCNIYIYIFIIYHHLITFMTCETLDQATTRPGAFASIKARAPRRLGKPSSVIQYYSD